MGTVMRSFFLGQLVNSNIFYLARFGYFVTEQLALYVP